MRHFFIKLTETEIIPILYFVPFPQSRGWTFLIYEIDLSIWKRSLYPSLTITDKYTFTKFGKSYRIDEGIQTLFEVPS